MVLNKKALKVKLLGQYAEHLDEMLDPIDEDHRLHISDIEAIALEVRQEVGEDVTNALTQQESAQHEVDVACPTCQQRMRAKGHKKKWVKTQTGVVAVGRPYYYCQTCRKGHFPPG
jgi:hypothetical protein